LGHFRHEAFMAVTDHGVHPGQRGNLLGRALSVTAGHQDARGGIFPVDFSQKSAGSAICLRSDTASVGNDYIGPGGSGSRAQAAVAQLGANDFAVRLAGPTPEVLNVVFCHVASLIK
jgi:hypothetical protein